jgi:hypothetical protein
MDEARNNNNNKNLRFWGSISVTHEFKICTQVRYKEHRVTTTRCKWLIGFALYSL